MAFFALGTSFCIALATLISAEVVKAVGGPMALSRWRVGAAPSEPLLIGGREAGIGAVRWRLELQRCRLSTFNQNTTYAGHPKTWQVEWRDETGDLSVVTALRDGPVEPAERWRAASCTFIKNTIPSWS